MVKGERIEVRFPRELKERLIKYCDKYGAKMSTVIKKALEEYLDKMEKK